MQVNAHIDFPQETPFTSVHHYWETLFPCLTYTLGFPVIISILLAQNNGLNSFPRPPTKFFD